jgi:outer membrane biogenesis lipoprotein LolB
MKRLLGILLAAAISLVLVACATPRQAQPNNEKIRQDHKKAQQDLRREEDRKKEEDSE